MAEALLSGDRIEYDAYLWGRYIVHNFFYVNIHALAVIYSAPNVFYTYYEGFEIGDRRIRNIIVFFIANEAHKSVNINTILIFRNIYRTTV